MPKSTFAAADLLDITLGYAMEDGRLETDDADVDVEDERPDATSSSSSSSSISCDDTVMPAVRGSGSDLQYDMDREVTQAQ